MKRYVLLLTAALGMAAAQPSAPVSAVTPTGTADRQLSGAAVTFDLRRMGSDLTSMLLALAKSAGYEILIDPSAEELLRLKGQSSASNGSGVPSPVVSYSFASKPFNEIWPIILDMYGLNYEVISLGGRGVIRITADPIQKIIKLDPTFDAITVQDELKLAFGSRIPATTKSEGTATSGTVETRSQSQTTSTASEIKLDSQTLKIVGQISTNSIIIRGSNKEVAQVELLLNQIVANKTPLKLSSPPPTVQRIYTVKGAPADVTALLTAQFPELRTTAVGQTGQIVITGPQNRLEAALTLLGQVDRSTVSTQAEAPTAQRVYAVKGQQADIVTLLGAQFSTLKVTPVGQTGQLVLTGPQTQLDAALALLGQVDRAAPPVAATVQRLFQLVNASAEEVKAVLLGQAETRSTESSTARDSTITKQTPSTPNAVSTGTAVQTQEQTVSRTVETPAQQGLLSENPPTIIADKRTNTLIVRGTPEQVTQIAELIPKLDQVVPQINVQVRIQEINETAARTLGMDWKVNFGGFNVNVGGSGLGATFDPTRSLVGFNIFPTLQALETQGFTKRVYDGNISMQSGQRSLGTGTTSQNASANAAASIKSGGRLEINIPSNSGNIEKQIDYGLNLDFFDPQVAPDGTITLRVRGQVNNIAGALPTTELPNLLNFTNSEAQSTITFKNGQTVLMSGLLGTTESRTTNGVPLLSSIPIIGAAFSKQTTDRSQTQLLVIITGTVVK